MARFILKWRYIKSGSAKHNANFVKYIATREGVERCDESWKHQPATVEQQRLVKNLVADFPDSVQSFEYQDYISAPAKGSASEFITRTIEDNVDLIGKKENYVGYIAKRPRVEKQGSHGLFTQEDCEINLDEVAKTVAEHEGAVWTTVMSLRREDAEKLGYDNAKAWRDMLRGQANKLSKAMGIPLADLRWYAAFHNEGNHPHIHLVSYSVGKEPYMTEQGLLNFKSDFAREIFKHDLYHIYEDMTAHRDDLRRTGREKMNDIVSQINGGTYDNETIKIMLRELVQELDNHKGKMVYGYMSKKAKNIIDGIVDELAIDAEKFCSSKCAIFIVLPEENPATYFMVSLLLQQLYREILTVADEQGGALKDRVMFYMDEFGTLPAISSAEMMYSASRSRKLSLVSIIQSYKQLEKNYGSEGADIIKDNCQVTIAGGFAPTSGTADEISRSLGNRTVMTGSVSRSKNDPSQSLQMTERPLMTADELKSMKKGNFIVMKTGTHPFISKLKLFFKWGIDFDTEKYTVEDKGTRKVHYTNKDIIEEQILDTFPSMYAPPARPSRRAATGGQALSQSDEPLIRTPENQVRTD